MTTGEIKKKVKEALLKRDIDTLRALVKQQHRVVNMLVSMSYDKDSLLTWRAIEAIGPVVKELTDISRDKGRDTARRLLWSITEESGGLGWSAIEMLAEIVVHAPGEYGDLVPMIMEFYDEEFLRPGVLYAICRIGTTNPNLIRDWDMIKMLIEDALRDENPKTVGMGLYALKCLKERLNGVVVPERVFSDERRVLIYSSGSLESMRLMDIAQEVGR